MGPLRAVHWEGQNNLYLELFTWTWEESKSPFLHLKMGMTVFSQHFPVLIKWV
jgi:hypothetical protein